MFAIQVPYLDLRHIYESAQECTWHRFTSDHSPRYIIPVGDRYCVARQNKDMLYFYCTTTQFFDYLWEYFDLAVDYRAVNLRFRKTAPFARDIGKNAKGLHVLRQPMWHSILNACMVHAGGPTAIRSAYAYTCSVCGSRRSMSSGTGAVITFPAVPEPEAVIRASDTLRANLRPDVSRPLLLAALDYLDGWYGFSELDMSVTDATYHMRSLGYWSERDVRRILISGWHYRTVYYSNAWADSVVRHNTGYDRGDWVRKKLKAISGNESVAALYMQHAYIRKGLYESY